MPHQRQAVDVGRNLDKKLYVMEIFTVLIIVAIILIPFINFVKYQTLSEHKKNLKKNELESGGTHEIDDEVISNLAQSIYGQYQKAKGKSHLMMGLSILTLIVGGILFYNSADLASIDNSKSDESIRGTLRASISDKYLDSFALNQGYDIDSLREITDQVINISPGNQSRNDSIKKLKEKTYEIIKDFEAKSNRRNTNKIEQQTQELYSQRVKDQGSSNFRDSYFLFTTLSLRILITILAFFFIKIFLRLFKYYVETSDFYINRFDAITAFKEQNFSDDFSKLAEIFQHKISINIGPKTPIDTIMEIMKNVKPDK
jgi:hypothetical protein